MDYHSQVVCPNGKIWTFVPKVNMYYRSQYVCPYGKIWSIVPKVKLDYRSQICPNGKIGTIVPKGKMDCRSQVVSPSGKNLNYCPQGRKDYRSQVVLALRERKMDYCPQVIYVLRETFFKTPNMQMFMSSCCWGTQSCVSHLPNAPARHWFGFSNDLGKKKTHLMRSAGLFKSLDILYGRVV